MHIHPPTQPIMTAALLVLLALILIAPKLRVGQRSLGYLALVVGVPAVIWLAVTAGMLAGDGAWRAAAEEALVLYGLATATWLAWKSAKPY